MIEFNGLLTRPELLDFSQNFLVERPEVKVDPLFPDRKTDNMAAEYQTLSADAQLPIIATVHARDAESEIGNRPSLDSVSVEKMLIKRKINLTERMRELRDHAGVRDSALKRFVFDDMARLSEAVLTRTKVMKAEAMSKGKLTVKENDLNLEVDYKVPAENMAFTFDWSTADADPSGDLQTIVDSAGYGAINGIMLSGVLFSQLRRNAKLQTLILGNANAGALIPRERLNAYLADEFGFARVIVNDDVYGVEKGVGSNGKLVIEKHRYFPQNKISLFSTDASGAFGVGLWGVTPEEEANGPFSQKSSNQFVTITQWQTPDPVATWTKASGLFIPVIPNPARLFVATVTATANAALNSRSVTKIKV